MNIVFICGCLEPGVDGVGDYSRRLAGELIRMGNKVQLISLNDYHIDTRTTELQEADGTSVQAHRLPSKWPRAKAYEAAQEQVKLISPEWISIQYVPFSFHPKGLPFGLAHELKHIIGATPVHIMFHELWVGVRGKVTFKQAVLKQAQRFLIKRMISVLNPAAITTNIPIYRDKLLPLKVGVLPLFANIPLNEKPAKGKQDNNILTVIHFGSFTGATADFELQLKYIQAISLLEKRELKLVTVGSGGPFKGRALQVAKNLLGEASLTELGVLPAAEISGLLYKADIGISRSDYLMYGKSGSTIAILEHGLPVILRGARPKSFYPDNELFKFTNRLMFVDDGAKTVPGKAPAVSNLHKIAGGFINILNKNES